MTETMLMPMPSESKFQLTIASEAAKGQAVQERIIKLLEEFEYTDRDVFGVRLALEEAIVNAIKHGNGMDSSKNVEISCDVTVERAIITIKDEGKGFSLEDVPDPTAEENWERPCGRGILLMRSFINTVEYNDSGTQVRLEKLRGIDPPRDD